MAIDLELIRQKLKHLKSSGTSNKNKWRPEPGDTIIRIVPYQYCKENPFIELYFHYNVGKKNPLSLTTFQENDPIDDFANQLQQTGDSDEWKMGKKMEPTLRTFVPIIIRGKEKEGVKFWSFGKTIYQELLSFMADPDYGDITDLKSGRDIVVTYLTPKEAGNTYGKITIRVKPNPTPATTDKEIADMILNKQEDIFDMFPKPTYDELKQILKEYLSPDADAPAGSTTDTSDDLFPTNITAPPAETPVEPEVELKTKPQPPNDSPAVDDFEDLFK